MRDGNEPPPPPLPPPLVRPVRPGPRTPVDDLFDRQSTTLEKASARYVLKNGREPPRGYARWFAYARSKGCLIDDYERVWRDFEPFYQLADTDGKFFNSMVQRGSKMANETDMGMKTFAVKRGVANATDERGSSYNGEWLEMLQTLTSALTFRDMNIIVNHRDEPRVAFDARIPHREETALSTNDPTPFLNRPAPTSMWYTDQKHCLVPNYERGFLEYANNASSFLMYSASADFTTDLYPVLSQSKIYPCFSDILYPSQFHYPRSYWSPKYAFPNNVDWEEKKPVLYWRGQSTGGWISGDNYHGFPRYKVLDIARTGKAKEEAMMDVEISAFYEWFCQLDGCNATSIKTEYNITGEASAREDAYKYKYLLDLDGNSFSGRFLGLMKSGSLVFKSTLFTEYFDAWLRPYEHYIPVLPDLSDLVERIEWARSHDKEAKRIQEAGKEFAERVITDEQNDCYWGMVLIEWERLQSGTVGRRRRVW
ncbi:glycosyl transferase family 90-domain-containing protein [Mycena metata]|uniref:Glycosyl transferase family 90-domain-containing protein n=1 Tax=Mycena metata TaxID=1033252 RepID=A0AAD7ID96_9AGAR|nr:glycosyl transferase family 90-domain-containing protein [Mycena metata]